VTRWSRAPAGAETRAGGGSAGAASRAPSRSSILAGALVAALAALLATGCESGTPPAPSASASGAGEVVLYTSVDEDIARPVIARFEAETAGARVLAVFDVEATKTTGLVSRILAERAAPRADVFWSSDALRTDVLKREGALEPFRPTAAADIPDEWRDPDGAYTGIAARARVLVWNTTRLTADAAPHRLEDLLEPRFRGEVAIANPRFGTTGADAASLFALDAGRARDFFGRLLASGARVVDGNSVVRDLVAGGSALAGLCDTDDAFEAIDEGKPLAFRYAGLGDDATLVIPNTVALVRGGPHPAAARALVEFLVSAATERQLAGLGGRQMPVRPALADAVRAPATPLDRVPRRRVRTSDAVAALDVAQAFFAEELRR
jgi:iron(III) transport system substrate-binding protein